MITYRHDGLMPFKITVKCAGRIVGTIKKANGGGYYYRTKSGSTGEIFATVDAVKRSIEAD